MKGGIVLGISAYYHDSAAALIQHGIVKAAAQEERFSRIKNDSSFPINSVRFCLDYCGLTFDEIDIVVFYDKPFLKFERILETFYKYAPRGIKAFVKHIPSWIKSKLFLKNVIIKELLSLNKGKPKKILFSEHHLSHAASSFFISSFHESAILTIDGVGEWATTSIFKGENNRIEKIQGINFPNSIGLLYSSCTYYLGFKVNEGEYKVMGLSSFGDRENKAYKDFIDKFRVHIIQIFSDGSFNLNMDYFAFQYGSKMLNEKKWQNLFSFKKRSIDDEIEQIHCDFALAIQDLTEDVVLKLCNTARMISNSKNLCLAGGVALNCVINGAIKRSNLFENLFIQPASGDSGGAIGAALAAYYIYFDVDRIVNFNNNFNYSLLGPEYSNLDISLLSKKYPVRLVFMDYSSLYPFIAKEIANGKIVGWFQGRMEFGPRSLGNRSILADPRNSQIQKKINLNIKGRESFRPFAPAILEEDVSIYYPNIVSSPYMLLVDGLKEEYCFSKPDHYSKFTIRKKTDLPLSKFPAITHVDYSSRIQTVSTRSNKKFYELILQFKKITGTSMVLNTSMNRAGEPIVMKPQEAINCFMNSEMDILVVNNYIYSKKND